MDTKKVDQKNVIFSNSNLGTDFNIDEKMEKNKGKKGGNPHILSYLLKSCVADNYSNHLRMFTCGPVLENEQAGAAGFIITDFKTEREGGN